MVLQINDMTQYDSKDKISMSYLTHDKYPEQDERYLGKLIHLSYRDMGNGTLYSRLNLSKSKHPECDCIPEYESDSLMWKIIRCDLVGQEIIEEEFELKTTDEEIEEEIKEPRILTSREAVFIAIDRYDRIINTTMDQIEKLTFPPMWHIEDDEVLLHITETWEEFNEQYKDDPIFVISPQDDTMIGKIAYTEYYKDILKYDSATNRMVAEEHSNSCLFHRREFPEIKQRLLEGNPMLEKLPDVVIASFPQYYNRHEKSLDDKPRRAMNSGIIIKCSQSGVGAVPGVIIVAEYMEDDSIRFVTSNEAFMYYETETSSTQISTLNLYNM